MSDPQISVDCGATSIAKNRELRGFFGRPVCLTPYVGQIKKLISCGIGSTLALLVELTWEEQSSFCRNGRKIKNWQKWKKNQELVQVEEESRNLMENANAVLKENCLFQDSDQSNFQEMVELGGKLHFLANI